MALFEVTEYDKKVYEEQLKDFLPDKIFDVHVHVWLRSLLDPEVEQTVAQSGTDDSTQGYPQKTRLNNLGAKALSASKGCKKSLTQQ